MQAVLKSFQKQSNSSIAFINFARYNHTSGGYAGSPIDRSIYTLSKIDKNESVCIKNRI